MQEDAQWRNAIHLVQVIERGQKRTGANLPGTEQDLPPVQIGREGQRGGGEAPVLQVEMTSLQLPLVGTVEQSNPFFKLLIAQTLP